MNGLWTSLRFDWVLIWQREKGGRNPHGGLVDWWFWGCRLALLTFSETNKATDGTYRVWFRAKFLQPWIFGEDTPVRIPLKRGILFGMRPIGAILIHLLIQCWILHMWFFLPSHFYCWGTTSCTSWYGRFPVDYCVVNISSGAGLVPQECDAMIPRHWMLETSITCFDGLRPPTSISERVTRQVLIFP